MGMDDMQHKKEEYRAALTKLAKEHKNQRFLTGEDWGARVVAGLMVDQMSASEEVLIHTNALQHSFYADILRSSVCCFRIILGSIEGIAVVENLPFEVQNRLEIRSASVCHMKHCLVAGMAFRVEARACRDELYVVCNFNEPDVAGSLRKQFNELWTRTVPVPALTP